MSNNYWVIQRAVDNSPRFTYGPFSLQDALDEKEKRDEMYSKMGYQTVVVSECKNLSRPIILWLDDERDPKGHGHIHPIDHFENQKIVWVKSYDEFVDYLSNHPLPYMIYFDHDLGGDAPSGMDCAKWLVQFLLDTGASLPRWHVHSMNFDGAQNIRSLLRSFERTGQ